MENKKGFSRNADHGMRSITKALYNFNQTEITAKNPIIISQFRKPN